MGKGNQNYSYETTIVWQGKKEGVIQAQGNPELNVAAPPEFGGHPNTWSPEQLFTTSVAGCLMNTFLFFAEMLRIGIHSYSSTASGHMEKTPDGLRFTAIDVVIFADVNEGKDVQKAKNLQSKLEKYCPISTSLRCPVRLDLKITPGLSAIKPEAGEESND